jgi:hypothetical protein
MLNQVWGFYFLRFSHSSFFQILCALPLQQNIKYVSLSLFNHQPYHQHHRRVIKVKKAAVDFMASRKL